MKTAKILNFPKKSFLKLRNHLSKEKVEFRVLEHDDERSLSLSCKYFLNRQISKIYEVDNNIIFRIGENKASVIIAANLINAIKLEAIMKINHTNIIND